MSSIAVKLATKCYIQSCYNGTMKKTCRYCGKVHPIGVVCVKAARRYDKTDASRFRSTNAWTKKAKEIKARDFNVCRMCLAEGKLNYSYTEVHHIVPLCEDDTLALNNDNLITLCEYHHEIVEHSDMRAYLLELVHTPPTMLV